MSLGQTLGIGTDNDCGTAVQSTACARAEGPPIGGEYIGRDTGGLGILLSMERPSSASLPCDPAA